MSVATKKPVTIALETKTFKFEVKSIDEAEGIIKGYLSVFNNIDGQDDRVKSGAFKKSIVDGLQRKSNKGKKFLWPFLWMHDPEKPIGGFIDAIEDQYGLLVTAQLDINTNDQGYPMNPLATTVFSGFKMGYIDELSVGYKALQRSYDGKVRNLIEMQVFEGSAVTMLFAANQDAQVTDVKMASGLKRRVMEKTKTPVEGRKDFNDRYREEQIRDWKGADFQNLVIALQAAVMDIFAIGDEPQIDVLDTILNGVDNGSDDPGNKVGFIDALKDYVQKGIDLDVSNYLDDNSYFGNVSSYGYMSRSDKLEGKAGAVVSKDNADRINGHADTLMQVKDMISTVAEDLQHYVTGGPAYADDGKRFEPRTALKTDDQPPASTDSVEAFTQWLETQIKTKAA